MKGQSHLNEDRAAGETGPVTPSPASLSLTHSLSKHLLTVQLAGHCPGQGKGNGLRLPAARAPAGGLIS